MMERSYHVRGLRARLLKLEGFIRDDACIFKVGLNRRDGDGKGFWVLACGDVGVSLSKEMTDVWC